MCSYYGQQLWTGDYHFKSNEKMNDQLGFWNNKIQIQEIAWQVFLAIIFADIFCIPIQSLVYIHELCSYLFGGVI